VELFFKWIKQHLGSRLSTVPRDAVKTQIWIAVSMYVSWRSCGKRWVGGQPVPILQILSLTLFEKRPILCVFSHRPNANFAENANHSFSLTFHRTVSDVISRELNNADTNGRVLRPTSK